MKLILKILSAIFVLFLVLVLSAYVVVAKPYQKVEWVRADGGPITIRAQWVAWACGGNERITELDDSGNIAGEPLSIRVPKGTLNPENSIAAYPGNIFVLTGYRLRKRVVNIFTRGFKEQKSLAFDVTTWSVELPYVSIEKEEEPTLSHSPLGWVLNSEDLAKASFVNVGGGGC